MKTDDKLIDLFYKLDKLENTCDKENCMKQLQEYDYVMSVIHNLLQVKRYEFTLKIDKLATEYFKELKDKKEN